MTNTYINLKNDFFFFMQAYKRDRAGRFKHEITDEQAKVELAKELAIGAIFAMVIGQAIYAAIFIR